MSEIEFNCELKPVICQKYQLTEKNKLSLKNVGITSPTDFRLLNRLLFFLFNFFVAFLVSRDFICFAVALAN